MDGLNGAAVPILQQKRQVRCKILQCFRTVVATPGGAPGIRPGGTALALPISAGSGLLAPQNEPLTVELDEQLFRLACLALATTTNFEITIT